VISVGSFHAGTAANVIAATAKLSSSIRSLNIATRDFLVQRMREIAEGICAAYGAACEVEFIPQVLPTVSSEAGAALMRDVATTVVGAANITQMRPMMVGEDMSEFLNRAPGGFVLVGAWDTTQPENSPHHNPTFDFDERMLATGVALLAGTAVEYLARAG
jgi:amidohydrolase